MPIPSHRLHCITPFQALSAGQIRHLPNPSRLASSRTEFLGSGKTETVCL